MDVDASLRHATRILTLLAFAAFLAWLVVQNPVVLVLAALLAVVAYTFFWWSQERDPVDHGRGYGRDAQDRVDVGSEDSVSPGVSVGGIHLTFETRSRWRPKR